MSQRPMSRAHRAHIRAAHEAMSAAVRNVRCRWWLVTDRATGDTVVARSGPCCAGPDGYDPAAFAWVWVAAPGEHGGYRGRRWEHDDDAARRWDYEARLNRMTRLEFVEHLHELFASNRDGDSQ